MIHVYIYKVAYVEDGGAHGFAVCEMGSGPFDSSNSKRLPTLSELMLIKEKNNILRLYGSYWSSNSCGNDRHKTVDLPGNSRIDCWANYQPHDILYIYRF